MASRDRFVRVRVTEDERDRLAAAAAAEGVTLSSFVRRALLSSPDATPTAREDALAAAGRRPRKVYLSDRERDELARNARAVNMSASEYVRSRCVYRPAPYVAVDRDTLLECHRELYRQGVNLNQVAKQLNLAGAQGGPGEAVRLLSPHVAVTLDGVDRLVARMERIIGGTYRGGGA